jgi:hypothetical protein
VGFLELEGERKDWEDILVRLEKLKEYGLQTIARYSLGPLLCTMFKLYQKITEDGWRGVN